MGLVELKANLLVSNCPPKKVPTFLASEMPSELPGFVNKLALEYCSLPSPLAMSELLRRRVIVTQRVAK